MIPTAKPPLLASHPRTHAPLGSCDSHFHMIGGPDDYPIREDRAENPAEGGYLEWLDRLRQQMSTLGLSRGVIVQSILYGTDNTIVADTIRTLGADAFRGVAVVSSDVTDSQLDHMRNAGIVGIRVNYVHGGALKWTDALAMAPRLHERGMHIQMLINARDHIAELADDMRSLPVNIVLDHMGWPDLSAGVQEPGFKLVTRLLEEGHIWVKLSGSFRFCDAPYQAADTPIAQLAGANPDQCVWGSDWPYLMLGAAKTPDAGQLLDGLYRALPDAELRKKVLVDNPTKLYQF